MIRVFNARKNISLIKICLLLITLLNLPKFGYSNPSDYKKPVSKLTKATMTTAVLGANFIYYKSLEDVWWNGKVTRFYLRNDWYRNYALDQDKFSHFFAAQFLARQWATLFEIAGWQRNQAHLLGSFSALFTGTMTEILDGFQYRFGFSTPDFIANINGAFFPYVQEVYPPLRNLKFKISYQASPYFLSGGIDRFEDYDGMTFWWCFNFRNIMPENIKKKIPKFLAIALGHGVKNVWTGPNRSRELYLALDFDFGFLKVKNSFLQYLLNLVDQIHLWAPTIQVYPEVKTYYLFF